MGAVGGPVAGMIFLGGLFPQANWIVCIYFQNMPNNILIVTTVEVRLYVMLCYFYVIFSSEKVCLIFCHVFHKSVCAVTDSS